MKAEVDQFAVLRVTHHAVRRPAWRAAALQFGQRVRHRLDRGEERGHRIEHDLEAHLLQIGRGQRGGFVAVDDRDHLRPFDGAGHCLDLGDLLDAIDEDQVDAGIAVQARTMDRFVDAGRGQGVGAADDQQFVRDWLESVRINGAPWNKRAPAPSLPPEVIEKTAAKYREALTRLTA